MRESLVAVGLAVVVGICALVALAADGEEVGAGQEVDRNFPPYVVKTEPASRAKDVASALREIKVTFDRPMMTEQQWSWIIHRNLGTYPGYRDSAEPRWEDDGRTCVLSVRLTADTLYAVGVNSFRHSGFRDTDNKIAVPHVWVFKTAKIQ
jgi:hypothetical protein